MILLRRLLGTSPWLSALVAFIVLIPSISNQSLDLEESQTWSYARLPSVSEALKTLQSDANIESQMPLAMVTACAWGGVFGTGEMAMRSLNLVWAAIALAAFALVARQTNLPWLPLLFAIQPFVWYSMDAARTPVMQMAGGALLLAGTIKLLNGSQRWLLTAFLLSLGSLVLVGANMFGLVPLVVVLMFLLGTAAWRQLLVSRASKIFLFATAGLLVLLGVYYFSTVVRGAGGVKLWAVTPFNLLIIAYEFLGFGGLGPGRQELRDIMRGVIPATALLPHIPGWLALLAAYLVVGFSAIKSWLTRAECAPRRPSVRNWVLCVTVPAVSAFLLFCFGTATGVPFWGRSLAGTLPFSVTAIGIIIYWSTQGLWRGIGRIGAFAVIVLLMFSCVLMRLHPDHRHDNYRDAAGTGRELAAKGGLVWWVAGNAGGEYYGIHFVQEGAGIVLAPNRSHPPDVLPDVIIISKPENFDAAGTAQAMIRSRAYRKLSSVQAFDVWTLQSER